MTQFPKLAQTPNYFVTDVFSLGLTILEAASLRPVDNFNDFHEGGPDLI
jgi:hypothetical protein